MRGVLTISWAMYRGILKHSPTRAIAIVSILCTTVSLAALANILAVTSGFEAKLLGSLRSIHPDIYAYAIPDGIALSGRWQERFQSVSREIQNLAPMVLGETVTRYGDLAETVLLRGQNENDAPFIRDGAKLTSDQQVILGETLLKVLNVSIGDSVEIMNVNNQLYKPFEIVGIASTGIREYDRRLVLTRIPAAQELLSLGRRFSGLTIQVNNFDAIDEVAALIESKFSLATKTLTEIQSTQIKAIKTEKITIVLIISLSILLAMFNSIASQIVWTRLRDRQIKLLRALGQTKNRVALCISLTSTWIVSTGVLIGVSLSLAIAQILRAVPIDLPHPYIFEELPVHLEWTQVVYPALVFFLIAAGFGYFVARFQIGKLAMR